MGWWKADPVPDSQPQPSLPTSQPPLPPPPQESSSACPVDPKTRSIWLQQAQAQSRSQVTSSLPPSHPPLPPQQKQQPSPPPAPSQTPQTALPGSSRDCSSDRISQSPQSHPDPSSPLHPSSRRPLSHERSISSIPRASPTPSSTIPANAEAETITSPQGNWIYPSESQFYRAVVSKQTASSPDALLSSISHIIPIHNAVNERAWHLIKSWEGSTSSACGGPKLHSFSGKGAGALSPKAKWKSWILGYTEPFDRHDWVIERCGGERVEYVIDFYQGKAEAEITQGKGKADNGKLNFYLDVRPKLNSWEGWRMRGERAVGWR